MNKLITSTVFTMCSLVSLAQNELFLEWGVSTGNLQVENTNAMVSDIMGNTYQTGFFQGTVDFDPGTGTTNIVSAGGKDIFIRKLDSDGNLVWLYTMGGVGGEDVAYGIAMDPANTSVYVTGIFDAFFDFNAGAGTTILTPVNGRDIFVLKIDAGTSNFVWAKSFGGTLDDYGYGIAVDDSENVYTTGAFRGSVDFDPGAGTNTHNGGASTNNIFVSKLDYLGNFVFANSYGSTTVADAAFSIVVDPSLNIYFCGAFQGTATFGSTNLISNGGNDAFVTMLDISGNVTWAKSFGSTGNDLAYALALNSSNMPVITGFFEATVDFDPDAGIENHSSNGSTDAFIMRLGPTGNLIWANTFGGSSTDAGRGIFIDNGDQIYVAGYFNATVDFDPGAATYSYTTNGNLDAYVAKYDYAGIFQLAQTFGSNGVDVAVSIGSDYATNVYLSGNFNNTMDIDPSAAVQNLVTGGSDDVFLVKLMQCTTTVIGQSLTNCDNYEFGSQTLTSSGAYTETFQSVYGCDSIVNLTFTKLNPTSSSLNISSCGSFISPSGNYLWINSGTFNDTILNTDGCDSVITVSLAITNFDDAISLNVNTLTASQNGVTYQWYDCNLNSIISGATLQSYTPSIDGNYSVILSNGTCTDTSACFNFTFNSVNEHQNVFSLNALPNPFIDYLEITSDLMIDLESYSLYSITGSKIAQGDIVGSRIYFNSSMESGMYILEVKSKNGEYFKLRIIK